MYIEVHVLQGLTSISFPGGNVLVYEINSIQYKHIELKHEINDHFIKFY